FLRAVSLLSPGDAEFTGPNIDRVVSAFSQSSRPYIARHLANAHTLFNIMSALIFLPFIGFFARSAERLLPGKKQPVDIEPRPKYIDDRVVNTPPIALLQVKNELRRMADIAGAMYGDLVEQFSEFDAKRSLRIKQEEEALDILQRDISSFLVLLSRRALSTENSLQIPVMLQLTNELEHLGDQVETILECLYRKKENKVLFSAAAISELKALAAKVSELVGLATESLGSAANVDLAAGRALRDSVARMEEEMNAIHMKRLTTGKCSVAAGMIYGDIVTAFNKIAEYSFNIIETEKGLF
ncbi:MAG TPA: PhoU domain-containing protein, partial [Geobacteraceae bacterium]